MHRMNCWRTTWGATLSNVGNILTTLALADAAGVSPFMTSLSKSVLGWVIMVALVLKSVGTQWTGMAAADQMEVKKQFGLKADGFPMYADEMTGRTIDDRARLGLGVEEPKQGPPTRPT